MTTVSVLGNGAWGTALALSALRAGRKTLLWGRNSQIMEKMQTLQENTQYLSGLKLDPGLQFTSDLNTAIEADIILIVTPAQQIRELITSVKKNIPQSSYIVLCSKGIEIETGLLMNELLEDLLPKRSIAVLSGPTFAREVASGSPTAATLAASEITTSRWLAMSLHSQNFRLYPSDDLTGVALSGALKNVIAIASGIATSRNFGESTRATLITRGLAEITRLGKVKNAHPETFLGLSGVGDLILSCTSTQSRNMSFGIRIGEYERASESPQNTHLTEGVYTAKAIKLLSEKLKVEMPICAAVYNIIYEDAPIEAEIKSLLARSMKNETYL